MIPKSEIQADLVITEKEEPSRTYKLFGRKIQGLTDGIEAIKQAIYKALNTEKYEYPIYSFNYGAELESLIGKDPAYVKVELKRRITECLMQDDRIQSVDNFTCSAFGDTVQCKFDVKSIYGTIPVEKAVTV